MEIINILKIEISMTLAAIAVLATRPGRQPGGSANTPETAAAAIDIAPVQRRPADAAGTPS